MAEVFFTSMVARQEIGFGWAVYQNDKDWVVGGICWSKKTADEISKIALLKAYKNQYAPRHADH